MTKDDVSIPLDLMTNDSTPAEYNGDIAATGRFSQS
jgi:hypothetical protein